MASSTQGSNQNSKTWTHPKAGRIFTYYAFGIAALYLAMLPVMKVLIQELHTTVINSVIGLLLFCSLEMVMAKHIGLTYRQLGIRFKHTSHEIKITLGYSALFMLALLLVKYIAINTFSSLSQMPLFSVGALAYTEISTPIILIVIALIYIVFTPLQVFLIHGAFQGPFMDFIPYTHKKTFGTIAGALMMSFVHLPINLAFALVVLIPALLWAYLYARFRSIFLIAISHALIGVWGLFFLDYGTMTKILEQAIA